MGSGIVHVLHVDVDDLGGDPDLIVHGGDDLLARALDPSGAGRRGGDTDPQVGPDGDSVRVLARGVVG